MVNKYTKKCSTFLARKERQILRTLRFHLHPSQNGNHKEHAQQMLMKMWEERNPYTLVAAMHISSITMEISTAANRDIALL
jgi:hypothetical protein